MGLVLKLCSLCLFGVPRSCQTWARDGGVGRGPVGPSGLGIEGRNLPGPHQPTPLLPGQQCQPSPGTLLWTGDFKV